MSLFPNVASMLADQRITAPEVPFDHDGYSGATMSRIEQDGRSYVMKRVSRTVDWIIQMTSDHAMREAQIAASDVLDVLAPGLTSPSITAARDGDGFALLMHDLTPWLLPKDGLLSESSVEMIVARVARMHASFWDAVPAADIGWCGMRERLLFLSEPAAERLHAAGLMEFGFRAGWERFHGRAPREVSALIQNLHRDPSSLISVFNKLPQTLVHNDVKTGNIAIVGDTLWLFDWALSGIGPICSDLGWLLAVNSSRLPATLDKTLEMYAGHLRAALGDRWHAASWDRQRAAAYLVGVMLLGWGKVDDAAELGWWCERALEAKSLLKL